MTTFVWLMFSAGSTEGRRLGWFGSLFVEVDQRVDGSAGLGVGLHDPLPLVVTGVIIVVVLLAVFAVYDVLLERRRQLLSGTD